MGAKTWMLAFSKGDIPSQLQSLPTPDRTATAALAARFFPKDKLQPLPDGTLSWTNPARGEVFAGVLDGVSVIASSEFALDYPSRLPAQFLTAAGAATPGITVVLHAMHSIVDWFAFAIWRDGQLVRSLSLSPDSGVMENLGEPLPFERPYWAGEHSADDSEDLAAGEEPYPLPLHPLELGEAALVALFGYQLEGTADPSLLDPDAIALMRFKRKQSLLSRFW